jgi:hypothetical protein
MPAQGRKAAVPGSPEINGCGEYSLDELPIAKFNRALKSTSFSLVDCCQTANPGFTNIDPVLNFKCPGPGNCTVTAEMSVQAGVNSLSGNRWAVVGLLDGAYMGPGPFAGELPTDSSFVVTNWTDAVSGVTPGNHTLQSQIYTDDGATIANAHITYRLYKP